MRLPPEWKPTRTLLRRLRWTVVKPLASRLNGDERSRLQGAGVEFAGVRDYQPGDDVRRITASGEYFYAADAGQLEQVYTHLGSQIAWVHEQTEVTALASGLGATFLTVAGLLSLGWFGRFP